MGSNHPPLAGGTLDRDAFTRMRPELLAEAWGDARARVLRLRASEVPISGEADQQELALVLPKGEFVEWEARAVYLGRIDGAPMFAVAEEAAQGADVERDGEPHASVPGPRLETVPGEHWQHPFAVVAELRENDRQLLAVGSALLRWHELSGFSARDGSPTRPAQGGWARLDAEGGEHFPRTDPAVIVLIEHDGRVLLGSNVLWEQGRFSLLAGFVEAGESLEQAVLREVFEEAGVHLGEVEYVTSQPWPFPRSLMLGFRAKLAPGQDPDDLAPDASEISELRWFTRQEIRDPDASITLPGGLSIARWMLDAWAEEGEAGSSGA